MKKLLAYAKKSDIMNIKVEYNGKVYAFNLDEELRISEDNLNTEVKTHVRSYAFLAMLHKKLSIKLGDEQSLLKRISNRAITEMMSKGEAKITQAKAAITNNKKVIIQERKIAQIEELKDYLGVAVNAFTTRKDLLQTLAANTRIESKHT